MNRAGEYRAKPNKPTPKNQRLNFSLIHRCWSITAGRVLGKNRGTLDWAEKSEGREVGVERMVEWVRQYYPIYMYDCMNCECVYSQRNEKLCSICVQCAKNAFFCHVSPTRTNCFKSFNGERSFPQDKNFFPTTLSRQLWKDNDNRFIND